MYNRPLQSTQAILYNDILKVDTEEQATSLSLHCQREWSTIH